MNRCSNCNLSVYSQHKNCPLCGKLLGSISLSVPFDKSETSYPQYIDHDKKRFTIDRMILFLAITLSIVSVYVNIFTLNDRLGLWSITVSVSLITLWLIVRVLLLKKIIGRKIMNYYAIISSYLIVIDVLSGFNKWSTTYVVPFLTIAVTLIFTIIAISNNTKFREYLGSLIAVFFISICPIIIFVFSLSTQAWTSFIAISYCLLTMSGLFIFSGREFKREIAKRFHL